MGALAYLGARTRNGFGDVMIDGVSHGGRAGAGALSFEAVQHRRVLAAVPVLERTARGIKGLAGRNTDRPPLAEDRSGRRCERFLTQGT